MAEYYTGTKFRGKRPKRSGRWGYVLFVADLIATIAMVLLLLCTIATIIGQYVSPSTWRLLSVISLGAPIIYLLDVAVMFYWVARWRWYRAVVMIVTVVIGLFYLPRYYKISLDRQYPTTYRERAYTKIMTYNVLEGKKAELVPYIRKHNPDIICLQEMTIGSDNWNELITTYKHTYKPDVGKGGNQILSKYKILQSGGIGDLPRRTATWADLKIADDTVRVVSLHLQSTSIRPEDTHFIEGGGYIRDNDREVKLRSIVSRLVENNAKRAEQAELVADFLAQTPHRKIVCGDFNDVPLSYTYHTIAKELNDSFTEGAVGFAYTYDTQYRLLRIDNILVSPEIEVASYDVDNEIRLSDHFPVVARVKVDVER